MVAILETELSEIEIAIYAYPFYQQYLTICEEMQVVLDEISTIINTELSPDIVRTGEK